MAKRRRLNDPFEDAADEGLSKTPTIAALAGVGDSGTGILTPVTSQSEQSQQRVRTSARILPNAGQTSPDFSNDEASASDAEIRPRRKKRYRELSHVVMEGPGYPRSLYQGWTPQAQLRTEVGAISSLQRAFKQAARTTELEVPDFTFFFLDDFSIYRPATAANHSHEMVCLERLTQDRYPEFLVDGVLSVGNDRYHIKGAPFTILSLDGYGDPSVFHMTDQIYIQSTLGRRHDVWYKLGRPSAEYHRFYQPFLWLAQFTKHFVDYIHEIADVTLQHFRRKFYRWLESQCQGHGQDLAQWLSQAPGTDFRTTVAAHYGFLWKECWNIDRTAAFKKHPLWAEIDPRAPDAIKSQPNKEMQTVVTPFAHDCFRNMYFGEKLKPRGVAEQSLLKSVRRRKKLLHLTPFLDQHRSDVKPPVKRYLPTRESLAHDSTEPLVHNIVAGDVVCVRPDTDTKWSLSAEGCWLAYVQRTRRMPHPTLPDRTMLDVLWLYEPADTTLGKAYYPFRNELFLSDNCNCGKEALDSACVLSTVPVSWFISNPYTPDGLFVRQKFRTVHDNDTYDFVSLKETDFCCSCDNNVPIFEECRSKYAVGDMVLVRDWYPEIQDDRLQPMQIVRFDSIRRIVVLRRFKRRREQYGSSRLNELVPTSETCEKPPSKVIRKCHVRCFTAAQIAQGDIITPYDRDGTGDFYFVASEECTPRAPNRELPPFDQGDKPQHDASGTVLPPINRGWDPLTATKPKLCGMGIFCGGGTFDRGLEEGGAVKFRYAVDWAKHALHSYRANLVHPDKTNFFLGSVNDYLAQAMDGSASPTIARPGSIQVLSAGSPCPGFSSMQIDKLSDGSKQNASMVASVVSFVDFFVPEYLILENVATMTNLMGPKKDQNVFAQIVASLVGMGYQVQQFLMDAWSYGSSQQRTRLFIVASAPGLAPLPLMPHTHAHPDDHMVRSRALGKSSNGLPFGVRREEYTPFQHVSPRQVTSDLPWIGDSLPQICTRFPDHRTPNEESIRSKERMAAVPTRPPGMGLMQAKRKGILRGEPLEYCEKANAVRSSPNSSIFARVRADFLFPTVITRISIGDGINGRSVHWDQNRTLTVLEARRAQGYPDEEVLIGDAGTQFKIVGNSVDRKVALVLGLALRESWMEHSIDGDVASLETVPAAIAEKEFTDLTAGSVDRPGAYVSGASPVVIDLTATTPDEGPADDTHDDTPRPPTNTTDEETVEQYEHDEQDEPDDSEDELAMDMAMIREMDNRTAKIRLNLTQEEREAVKSPQAFKAINRILQARRLSGDMYK